ncbi:unnamed protein product [Auanema sp. JU1783]|nr:unnamed protein product [Auanema sp. JU1783]
MSTPSSPAWKNPRERMTKHLKRRSSRYLNVTLGTPSIDDLNTESCPPMTPGDTKNLNPFKKSPEIKRFKKTEEIEETTFDLDDTTANDPFSPMIPLVHNRVAKVKKTSFGRSKSMQSPLLDFSNMDEIFSPSSSTEISKVPIKEERRSQSIPVDLRLGTKLRITSKAPFPWIKSTNLSGVYPVRLTGNDRTEGMKVFLNTNGTETMKDASPLALYEASSLYWQFPSLPWMSFYPRIDSLLKFQPKQTVPPMAQVMLDHLSSEWTECFEQLFLSWKKGERKSFYVLCSSFTALFTKSNEVDLENVGDDSMSCFQCPDGSRHIAIITPTTLGFRRYLKNEGIEYELCQWKKRRLSKTTLKFEDALEGDELSLLSEESCDSASKSRFSATGDEKENSEGKALSSDSDESPTKKKSGEDHDWLNDVGVSPKNTLKFRRHKSMTSNSSSSRSKDETDETSAVLVTGSSVQTLYNFIQTEKVCRSIAGPHANLPPTLIASKPFLHGQLKSLKKTSQVIKRIGNELEYVTELEGGPLMLDHVQTAVQFVRNAGLCDESQVQLRVNDRYAYAGLNGTENNSEWTEISISKDEIIWKA